MGKILMITSCKGGVGKTTVAANLASVLASQGRRVTAVDCDFGMRCLDLVMGAEDRVIRDFSDCLVGDAAPADCLIDGFAEPTLRFLAAPYNFEGAPDPDRFADVIRTLAGESDYVLLDTPGDRGEMLRLAASVADTALILATHQPASIRAAERTAGEIAAACADRRLIINEFDAAAVKSGHAPGVIDIIDRTAVQLIGIIPYSRRIAPCQEKGELMGGPKGPLGDTNVRRAFVNIAARLEGGHVPLLDGFYGVKRSLLTR